MISEAKLIKGCLKNDRVSQKQLYEQYAGVMLGVCYRYTRSLTDAEDVLQEGFVKAFTNLEKFRGDGNLGAWIRRIMVTTALNHLKAAAHRSGLFADLLIAPDTVDAHAAPDVQLDAKELADLIRTLPAGYRAVFNLYAIEGYTHREIGELLGISEGTSKSQYARARAQLMIQIDALYSLPKQNSYDQR